MKSLDLTVYSTEPFGIEMSHKHFSVTLFSTLENHYMKTLNVLIFFFAIIEFVFVAFTNDGCVLLGAIL